MPSRRPERSSERDRAIASHGAQAGFSVVRPATRRRERDDGLVIHTVRGVQFASWAFSLKVREAGIAPSMGEVGSAYDNAMVESFWARMQVELLSSEALL